MKADIETKRIQNSNENDATMDSNTDTSKKRRRGCFGLIRHYQVTGILIFAVIGIGAGIGISSWQPENEDAKDIAVKWIGLVGDLFLRALQCFVLPLVFVNVIVAVVEMVSVGKASSVGYTVIGLYFATTLAAALFGIVSTLAFMGLYNTEEDIHEEEISPLYIQLGCNDADSVLAEAKNGTITCISKALADGIDSTFILHDLNNTLVETNSAVTQVSISDTVYEGIFEKIVPNNIIGAFADSNFTAIIFFAVLFGAALSPVILKEKNGGESSLMTMLKETDLVFQRIIRWIIDLTPFAVCSLIASAVGEQEDLLSMFSSIGLLMASTIVGWGLQVVVIYIGLFALLTKSNPFGYLKQLIPAQMMAFATSSSAATIPASLAAVKSTGRAPDTISRFVIPFGATVNMDGGAVYFVCACIWLAVLNGEDVTVSSFFMLIIIATIGSMGTAPVPSAGLVLMITAYNTVFGTADVPHGFGYIVAIDWFMDRCQAACNITGDCIVTAIVAHRCPVDETPVIMVQTNDDDRDSLTTEEEDEQCSEV